MTIIELLPLDLFGEHDEKPTLAAVESSDSEKTPIPTTPKATDEKVKQQTNVVLEVVLDPRKDTRSESDEDATESDTDATPEEADQLEKDYYTPEEAELVAIENEKLVYYVANRFRSTGVSVEELSSVGFLGYAKAIKTYDKNRNVKFSTYAINVIKNEICYFLRKESKHMRKNVSLNTILSTDQNGNPFELSDIIDDEDAAPLDEDIMINDRRDMLYDVIKRLTPKEQYIIMNRFELAGNTKKTQKQISEEINMSQANVSKLQKNAIKKLEFYLQINMRDRDLTLDKALDM